MIPECPNLFKDGSDKRETKVDQLSLPVSKLEDYIFLYFIERPLKANVFSHKVKGRIKNRQFK